MTLPTPTFFTTTDSFRKWFENNDSSANELWIGFYKKSTGRLSITYPEALDQLLCFGWIDGVRKSIDEESYVIRATPRKPGSVWSEVNEKRAKELVKLGLMHEAGMRVFSARDKEKTKQNSQARAPINLDSALERQFQAKRNAWEFFQAQPPGYRKSVVGWIMSGKQEETRVKRLGILIATSEKGKRIDFMRPGGASGNSK
jgi:uncharacterized protein YdeI (YjbR/CyaY-like superfamily)